MEARGKAAFLIEYAFALFHEFRLLVRVYRERGFAVIQACNPPDLIFIAALPFKLLGVRFIFDHHDLSPELYLTKFGRKGAFYWLLRAAEWLTFKSADFVVSANDTFREIAIARGGKAPETVQAVYSIPDRKSIYRTEPRQTLRKGRKFVLGYVGIIGDQDGLDHLVGALAHLVRNLAYSDFQAVVVGDGPALPLARSLAAKLGIEDHVHFAGYLSGIELMSHLSAFDIGIIPDPVNETNDKMSMNKVFEYCALGIPTVAYPLTETRRLLGAAGLYAQTQDTAGLASALLQLIQDDELRCRMAEKARDLAENAFRWESEAEKFVGVYEKTFAISEKKRIAEVSIAPATTDLRQNKELPLSSEAREDPFHRRKEAHIQG